DENEDEDFIKKIFAARKRGSMTEKQQKQYEQLEIQKRVIRTRTQVWIGCDGTHVELDEEENRMLQEACNIIFSSLLGSNRFSHLTQMME
ncbi:hypothetical protein PFISCL1PPCAC_26907, partial [Pristionchus fissidentatus]